MIVFIFTKYSFVFKYNKMALTEKEIKNIEKWNSGLFDDLNSNKPDSKKKYLNQLKKIVKNNDDLNNKNCNYSNNYNTKPNFYSNYYGSNNVKIIDNKFSNNDIYIFPCETKGMSGFLF